MDDWRIVFVLAAAGMVPFFAIGFFVWLHDQEMR
jgi:hypothetical protein